MAHPIEAVDCRVDMRGLRLPGGSHALMKDVSFTAEVACGELRNGAGRLSEVKLAAQTAAGQVDFSAALSLRGKTGKALRQSLAGKVWPRRVDGLRGRLPGMPRPERRRHRRAVDRRLLHRCRVLGPTRVTNRFRGGVRRGRNGPRAARRFVPALRACLVPRHHTLDRMRTSACWPSSGRWPVTTALAILNNCTSLLSSTSQ